MALPPIRREVLVSAAPSTAFALFTAHLGAWWPVAGHSVYGSGATVAFEGDAVVERLGAQESVWAEVTDWDPPTTFELAWHPGRPAGSPTTVRVTFSASGDQTLVSLVHSDWERSEQPEEARAEYGHGWQAVLGRYAARVGGRSAEPRWAVLTHRPGPAVADGGSVFQHPDFAEHSAFLDRLAARELLIAAGPLRADEGIGMAVVRVSDDAVDIAELARTDDQSVVRGLFTVEVQPWDVRLSG
jgi:uncharacterized protein YciI